MRIRITVLALLLAACADPMLTAKPPLCVHLHDLSPRQHDDYAVAAAEWDTAVGFELLNPDTTCDNAAIDVYPMERYGRVGETIGGATEGMLDLNDHAQIFLKDSDKWHYGVVRHELGHALGLEHEASESSTMFWKERIGQTISEESVQQLLLIWNLPHGSTEREGV